MFSLLVFLLGTVLVAFLRGAHLEGRDVSDTHFHANAFPSDCSPSCLFYIHLSRTKYNRGFLQGKSVRPGEAIVESLVL